MPKQIEFEGAIHEFPDDFTDADIAAALGAAAPAAAPAKPQEASVPGGASMMAGAMFGTAKAAPGIISLVNKGAKLGGDALKSNKFQIGGGAVLAGDMARHAYQGNYAGVAKDVGLAAGAKVAEKGLGALVKATAPAHGFRRVPGVLARGAGVVSKVANRVIPPVAAASTIIDLNSFLNNFINDPNTDPAKAEAVFQALSRQREGR